MGVTLNFISSVVAYNSHTIKALNIMSNSPSLKENFLLVPEKKGVVEGNSIEPIFSAFTDKEKREKYHKVLESTAANFLTSLKNFKG